MALSFRLTKYPHAAYAARFVLPADRDHYAHFALRCPTGDPETAFARARRRADGPYLTDSGYVWQPGSARRG